MSGMYWTMSLLVGGWVFSQMALQARWMGSWRGVWELFHLASKMEGRDTSSLNFPNEVTAMLALASLAALYGVGWPLSLAFLASRGPKR